jgi:hypothetical protein
MNAAYETKALALLTPAELPLIGTACRCCQRPLTAVDVFHRGTICGPCEEGTGPDRLPSLVGLVAVMVPVLLAS